MIFVIDFAVTEDGDYVYLHGKSTNSMVHGRSFDKTKQNKIRPIDLISDPFSLETELNWETLEEKQRPKKVGMYYAVVKFVQTAEDDYRLDVISCTDTYALDDVCVKNNGNV